MRTDQGILRARTYYGIGAGGGDMIVEVVHDPVLQFP